MTEIWGRKPGTLVMKRGVPASGAFKGHLVTGKVKSYDINTDRLVIKESANFHVQVLDMVVSKPFKVRLCNVYGEWLLYGTALPTEEI